jgi:hypothetical protein
LKYEKNGNVEKLGILKISKYTKSAARGNMEDTTIYKI